jgi:Carboxypeptidase regulatory-like domain/TonB-dependent Receptor Plug Domain
MTRATPIQTAFRALVLACCFLACCQLLAISALGQTATATLSGTVEDENGALIPNAAVTAINTGTAMQRDTTTDDRGNYVFVLLPPGTYIVRVQAQGFATVENSNVILNVGDQKSLRIQLKAGNISEMVKVTGDAPLINESPAVGTTVDRQFVENLPMNGRSFQSLFRLTPGVAITKTADNGEQGQFSVNGQRPDSNYFTVDGVSANIGVITSGNFNQATGGALPGFSASGGTNNLVSIDALREFQIQTSSFAPEFGRTPGAQVSIVTRSGTNEFSGTLFEYFRNDALDANDWFANANRLPKPAERQNDFGGVVGGPIIKNRTFFFFSYEGLRLRQPQVGLMEVPTVAARQALPASVQPYINALPLPNGPEVRNGVAQFNASISNPASLNATSIRVDHTINSKLTLFGRYNHAPSDSAIRGGTLSLNTVTVTRTKTQTLTLGSTWTLTSTMSNDLRFNYSRNRGGISLLLDDFGGAVPPPDSLMFPDQFASPEDSNFAFLLNGFSQAFYQKGINANNSQRQVNVVDNLLFVKGSHQLKFGIDYRRLSPITGLRRYNQFIQTTLAAAQLGNATSINIQRNIFGVNFLFTNLSLYGLDTWKAGRRLTLTYGVRWELNPPPSEANGNDPIAVTGVDNRATITPAPLGTPLYKTTYNNFAPRTGMAYQLSQKPGRETVVRGGFGIFYDLGSGTLGSVASAGFNPYGIDRTQSGAIPLPPDTATLTPAPLRVAAPFSNVFTTDPNLKLPRVYQFNVAVEQALGAKQTLSASYVGAVGRRLLSLETMRNPNPSFAVLYLTGNKATSDYHALQLQFQRRLSRGLQVLASYTWSHSIDTLSHDLGTNPPDQLIDQKTNRGPSDFDVRHSFNAAVTYNLPTPATSSLGRAILGNWAIDSIVTARSASPVNVFVVRNLGFGFLFYRPDLIQGVPLYIDDPTAAGGRRFNPAAFSVAAQARQGNLSRNALRGFPLTQFDLALRRQFKLTERFSLQFRAEFFNIFNHPNFADPDGNLGTFVGTFIPNARFGRSTQMLGRSLGAGGGFAGGFNPLYQIGGPRSIQFALKLQF